jgi:glutamate formiminotransferase/formiminotetrahydrofolate cyclodeaminase
MAQQIVECIPNFSEGRRPEVVDAIVHAIGGVEGITLLDRSSDPDHNRSVVTFVGSPAAVEQAAFAGIAKAAELIDMGAHSGEHPRMGAADVVPFVPISGLNMADCVRMAQRVGERVGKELDIPVYLYEDAATSEGRRNLENLRRGEYEGIRDSIESDPARKPDYGPARLGRAGAVAIGARQPLIAYNVYLTTDDVDIAKQIAKAVRHSSGGLRFVKGAGFLVDGKAQVSMNLTNFRKTPIARVVELIRREAKRYGVSIAKSELVGLIPQEAMEDAAAWYLQLDDFERQQVLERRMQSAQGESAGTAFLDALASSAPTPGGGSAAAHAGAVAAALVAMVGRLTIGKKKYAEVEAQMRELVHKAEALRTEFESAVDKDAAAFDAVMLAMKLPKGSDADKQARTAAVQAATLGAAQQPLAVAQMAVEIMRLAADAAALGNTNAISDAGTAAAMGRAALTGAGLNVRINAASLIDKAKAASLLDELRKLEAEAVKIQANVDAHIRERGGFDTI